MDQNFLNFMQFFTKFDKIVCWHPLLQEILDPPLITLIMLPSGVLPVLGQFSNTMVIHHRISTKYLSHGRACVS